MRRKSSWKYANCNGFLSAWQGLAFERWKLALLLSISLFYIHLMIKTTFVPLNAIKDVKNV
jgi:hypothetical protein